MVAEENRTPSNRLSTTRRVNKKQKSEHTADILATPEPIKKKKIQKSKINKKIPIGGKPKKQTDHISSLVIQPKRSTNLISPAKSTSFASTQGYINAQRKNKD